MFLWEGRSLGELYTKMRDEMPTDRPGSLSATTYADILSYILRFNGFPSGDSDLSGDAAALEAIAIESPSSD